MLRSPRSRVGRQLVVFFRNTDGSVPFVEWFRRLPDQAKDQCTVRLELLAAQGHRLRRPAVDYLRDGIFELRAKAGRVQLRMLYFYCGREAIVISHGFLKQHAAVPRIEIERALRRKHDFEAEPDLHTFMGPL